ncbi:MBL fold metallo-hydrolase [Opitutia bacterium KCR 482]|nr:MBL fold metallo-hydrolase [Opitutae bacterium KCR 482]
MNITTYELGQLGTNSYLLYPDNTNLAILVDAPLDAAEEIPARLDADGKKLAAILLTHGHWDHLWDAGALQKRTDAKLYAGAIGRELVESPEFQQKNFYAQSDFDAAKIDVPVKDGDTLDIAGLKIKCFEAEGHCPGSIVYYTDDGEHKYLFAGDVLFSGSVGRSDLWGGDFSKLEKAIKTRIYTLPDETIVLPGHGEATTVEIEKRSNPYVSE